MVAKPLVAGLLALGCLGAAAGGAYVAVRQNDTDAPAAVAPLQAPVAPAAEPVRAVTETESVVTPAAPADEPVERPAPAPAPPPAPRERPRVSRPAALPAPAPESAGRPDRPAAVDPSRRESPVASSEPPAASPRPEPPVVAPVPEPLPSPKPLREFVEVTVPAAAVIGLRVESSHSSERARVEDRVEARVTRDVTADGRVAIPAGSRMVGSIILAERGGKIKERARLGVRFHTIVFADGTEMPISSDAVYREGESPGADSARKIGGSPDRPSYSAG